jgi:hypothetical protein
MKINKVLILLFLMNKCILAVSQNIIWQTDGKKMLVNEFRIENSDNIHYKNLKNKVKSIEVVEVFAILDSSGKEILIYKADTSFKDAFTISEMRSFVQGQSDAIEKYKAPWTTIGGIAVSGAAAIIVNPVYLIAVSGVYCTGIGLIPVREKKLNISQEFMNNEPYQLGYKKASKHKRIKNSIIGSAIGLAIGLGTAAIINKNN